MMSDLLRQTGKGMQVTFFNIYSVINNSHVRLMGTCENASLTVPKKLSNIMVLKFFLISHVDSCAKYWRNNAKKTNC